MATWARTWAIVALLLGVIGLIPPGCAPEFSFREGPPDDGGDTIRPRCRNDATCDSFVEGWICDPVLRQCVECVPSLEATEERCGAGLYCEGNRCAIGCASDTDCPDGLTCDVPTHTCTGCTGDESCPTGTACLDGRCVPACTDDSSCPDGFTCCSGTCARLATDPLHCGGCGDACADTEDCINGTCGPSSGCPRGFGDCDGLADNGCETHFGTDRRNCGSCGNDCKSGYCNGGQCSDLECPEGLADCDGLADNGCETALNSVDSCGVCTKRCSSIHGQAACSDGTCSIVCDAGWDDCDDNTDTGCETSVSENPEHCGACGVVCTNENGTTACEGGVCTPECLPGFGSCDGDPTNGCETDVRVSLEHCGECGEPCELNNATGECRDGVCTISECAPGFEDCDGDARNGCEADLSSLETCGRCDNACSEKGGVATCEDGECRIQCHEGQADCNGGIANGCETNILSNILHCGECKNACPVPDRGTPACIEGVCGASDCDPPFADCNYDATEEDGDGCETNTTRDPLNCGGCGIECYFTRGVGVCRDGKCVLERCEDGYADCDGDPDTGCETRLGTTQNCSDCGDTCQNEHGSAECSDGQCSVRCAIGYGDCDGNPKNGCETRLNTNEHCGACGTPCVRDRATTSCSDGTCQVVSCASGYGNCDNESTTKNGCETRLNTLEHCGACDVPCALPHATETCATGTCEIVSCDPGYADCSPTLPGCEQPLGTNTNCSSCGDVCETKNVHVIDSRCVGTASNWMCRVECEDGYDDCDGDASNGCETDLNSPRDCGRCDRVCNLPRAVEICDDGECLVGSCESGYDNCDGDHTNGCEKPVSSDINNCGACNRVCSSKNGTPSCVGGQCRISCAAGFGDCNDDVSDGCEHSVRSDPANCGMCGRACTGSTRFCIEGNCRPRLDITVVNSNTTGSVTGTGANLTLQHALASPRGTYRAVLVGIASKGNAGRARPSAVTYNSQPMTLAKETMSSNQAWAGIYTIADANLPQNPGTYSVVISAGDSQNSFALIGNVIELTGVQQSGMVEATAGTARTDCSSPSQRPNDTITTQTEGALIYSVVGMYGGSLPGSNAATAGQTVTLLRSASDLHGLGGYIPNVIPPRSVAVTWNPTQCATSGHAVVAIKPATTP